MPNEKKSASRAISRGAQRGARQLDHRADRVLDLHLLLDQDDLGDLDHLGPHDPQLLLEADQRDHDLDDRGGAGLALDGAGGGHDRGDLHAVDVRPLDAEAAAARAEHRVDLVQLAHRGDLGEGLRVGRAGGLRDGDPLGELDQVGQELVQRRVEQADRDRQAGHRPEDPLEVALLEGAQLVRGTAPGRRRRRP